MILRGPRNRPPCKNGSSRHLHIPGLRGGCMDHLFRVAAAVLAAFFHVSAWSHGTITAPTTGTTWRAYSTSPAISTAFTHSSAAAACAAFPAAFEAITPTYRLVQGTPDCSAGTSWTWRPQRKSDGALIGTAGASAQAQTGPVSCPAGSSGTPPSCTCSVGYAPSPDGGSCLPYSCAAGLTFAYADIPTTSLGSVTTCQGGCEVSSSVSYCHSSGRCQTGGWSYSGATCSTPNGTATDPMPPAVAVTCPQGQMVIGQVNGQDVCGRPSQASGTTRTTSTAADGSTSTSTTTTTCDGTNCSSTTTTSTTGAGGSGGGTSTTTTTGPQTPTVPDPSAPPSSGPASVFAGSCLTAFSCEGDAIQCAIAREQHRRACTLFDDPTLLSEKGNQAVQGGDHPEHHPYSSKSEKSLHFGSVIDRTDIIGSQCPDDVHIPLLGSTLVIPISQLCGPAAMLGNILVGISMISALFIVFARRS